SCAASRTITRQLIGHRPSGRTLWPEPAAATAATHLSAPSRAWGNVPAAALPIQPFDPLVIHVGCPSWRRLRRRSALPLSQRHDAQPGRHISVPAWRVALILTTASARRSLKPPVHHVAHLLPTSRRAHHLLRKT